MRWTDKAEARTQYQKSLRTCRTLIRTSKRNNEKQLAREVKINPKKFFTYIRLKKKVKTNIGPLTDETGSLTQDSKHMSKILNSNFASVFTTEDKETIPEAPVPPSWITPLEIDVISPHDLKKYFDKLDTNKSMGPDSLSPRLLRELKQQILHPLTNIFNRSLQENKVPEDWKIANVTPIHKKGDKNIALNYRPISLTSVAG